MVVNDADLTGLKPDVMWLPPCRVVISVMVVPKKSHGYLLPSSGVQNKLSLQIENILIKV